MNSLYSPPPTEQVYKTHVPGRYYGYTVKNYFIHRFPFLSDAEWVAIIEAGRVTVNGKVASPGTVLRPHDFIVTRMAKRQEPPANRRLVVLYEDEHIRVFDKGAPLPIHPSGRYFQNSMTELLKERYPDEVPRPVQRLDVHTTGVVVFARSRQAAGCLMREFAANRVEKEYLALVEGMPETKRFLIDAPVGKIRGSARWVGDGLKDSKPALTECEWLAERDGRTLLRVRPHSGRTNQIRVHLACRGLPLVNDSLYGRAPEGVIREFGLHAYRLRLNCVDRHMEAVAAWPEHFNPWTEAAGLDRCEPGVTLSAPVRTWTQRTGIE